MTSLQRRLRQLETRRTQLRPVVVRWVNSEQREGDIDEGDESTIVVVVEFVDPPS
jgi:hypothetical protein